MKITGVTPWLINSSSSYWGEFLFVEVTTDEGITGWGEITTTTKLANRALRAMLQQIGAIIIGENPADIERLWHMLFRSFTYMGSRGAAVECVSAIDIALWDIRGKALGKPIYELLGGAVRDEIALYTHPDQRKFTSKEGVIAEIRDIVDFRPHRAQIRPLPVPGHARAARRLSRWLDDPQGRAGGRRTDRADPRDGRSRHRNPDRCPRPLRRSYRDPALPLPRGGRQDRLVRGARAHRRASPPSSRFATR